MTPITPLGGTAPLTETHGPITLTENVETALASFAARLGREAEAKAVLEQMIGAEAPGPGTATLGEIGAFWIGPDQWMVAAPHASHELLAEHLAGAAKGAASVTEQSDAWCRFDLSGEGVAAVFELLCALNMRAFPVGSASRTTIDHLGCFVIAQADEHMSVLGPRSSAGSLHHGLLTAMRSAH